jgi:hypothetical protein
MKDLRLESAVDATTEGELIPGSPLGKGLNIHKFDLLGEELYGGYPFYADFTPGCIKEKSANTRSSHISFSSSTKELFEHVSTSTSVSASLQNAYTMGTTFSATTKYSNSETTNVRGTTLTIQNQNGGQYVSAECKYKLGVNANVERAFKRLPVKINDPSDETFWVDYKTFLHDFGSHVITDVTYGSSVNQNTYSKSSSKYSQRMLTIRACLDMVGPTKAGKVNVSVCSGVSKTDIEQANSMDTTTAIHARGGTPKERANIETYHNLEQINQFLKDAANSKAGIDYKMEPIWNMLTYKFKTREDRARAMNLEAFYKGYLSFGCKLKHDPHRKIVLQTFALIKGSPRTAPKYHCILQPTGCHDDEDCHYHYTVSWCSCNGDTCVRHKTQRLASGQSKTTAYINLDDGWGWQGCDRNGLSCSCDDPNENWREVWSLANGGSEVEQLYEEIAFKKKRKMKEKIKMMAKAIKNAIRWGSEDIHYY